MYTSTAASPAAAAMEGAQKALHRSLSKHPRVRSRRSSPQRGNEVVVYADCTLTSPPTRVTEEQLFPNLWRALPEAGFCGSLDFLSHAASLITAYLFHLCLLSQSRASPTWDTRSDLVRSARTMHVSVPREALLLKSVQCWTVLLILRPGVAAAPNCSKAMSSATGRYGSLMPSWGMLQGHKAHPLALGRPRRARSAAHGTLKPKYPTCLLKILFSFLGRSLKWTAKDVFVFYFLPSKNL